MTETSPELGRPDLDHIDIASLCTRCGKCCTKKSYIETMTATPEDIAKWWALGRNDILKWVEPWRYPKGNGWSAMTFNMFVDAAGRQRSKCPFFKVDKEGCGGCKIHDVSPASCSQYPVDAEQMERDGCEILDVLKSRGVDPTGWISPRRRIVDKVRQIVGADRHLMPSDEELSGPSD